MKIEAGAAGKVFSIDAKVGQAVKAGDAIVTIEAMKMEIPVVAPVSYTHLDVYKRQVGENEDIDREENQ